MQRIDFKEKWVSTALFQFIFPISLKDNIEQTMFTQLHDQQFTAFRLDQLDTETAYYGDFHVSHRTLESYYLPFTNKILFPHSEQQKGFQRFSKKLNICGSLTTNHFHIPFQVHSIDVTICPYQIGFLTIRTEITEPMGLPLSNAIEFAACFREFEAPNKIQIDCDENIFTQSEKFVFDYLFKGMKKFFDHGNLQGTYFKNIPFFENERMFVHSLLSFKEGETINTLDVYRSGSLSGLTEEGNPYISANNLEYIDSYVKPKSYNRFAPNTYYFGDEHGFTCLTIENDIVLAQLASPFYGENYYGLLVNLFHKMVFFKIAHDYSNLNLERDTKKIENLIYIINSFTSNYFFLVFPAQSQGKEIYTLIRKNFNIDLFYNDTKETLFSLFKFEENTVTKRDSFLLLILTIYTVICGVFSMNLFTHDLKGKINWEHFKTYNPFEFFAMFIVFSGLFVSCILGIQSFYQGIQDRKNRKKRVRETVLSSKKQ